MDLSSSSDGGDGAGDGARGDHDDSDAEVKEEGEEKGERRRRRESAAPGELSNVSRAGACPSLLFLFVYDGEEGRREDFVFGRDPFSILFYSPFVS